MILVYHQTLETSLGPCSTLPELSLSGLVGAYNSQPFLNCTLLVLSIGLSRQWLGIPVFTLTQARSDETVEKARFNARQVGVLASESYHSGLACCAEHLLPVHSPDTAALEHQRLIIAAPIESVQSTTHRPVRSISTHTLSRQPGCRHRLRLAILRCCADRFPSPHWKTLASWTMFCCDRKTLKTCDFTPSAHLQHEVTRCCLGWLLVCSNHSWYQPQIDPTHLRETSKK